MYILLYIVTGAVPGGGARERPQVPKPVFLKKCIFLTKKHIIVSTIIDT